LPLGHISFKDKEDHIKHDKAQTTQGLILGAARERSPMEDKDCHLMPKSKKISYQVPSPEECPGKENLKKLREEELGIFKVGKNNEDSGDADSNIIAAKQGKEQEQYNKDAQTTGIKENSYTGQSKEDGVEDTDREATSTAAAGQLTGTKERARQKQ
jgi:hypothetical protein